MSWAMTAGAESSNSPLSRQRVRRRAASSIGTSTGIMMIMMKSRAIKVPIKALENKSSDTRKAPTEAHRPRVKKPRPVIAAAGVFSYAGKVDPYRAAESSEFPICNQDARSQVDYSPSESSLLILSQGL